MQQFCLRFSLKFVFNSLLLCATLGALFDHASAVVRDGRVDEQFAVTPISFNTQSRIQSLTALPDGRIIAAGNFVNLSGGNTKNIGRLNSDGSFDATFYGDANAEVSAVFPLSNGQILISGSFQSYGGIGRRGIARINSNGTLDQAFNPNFGTDFARIVAVQSDGKMIVTGTFQSSGGIPRSRIARLNEDGSVDLTFDGGTGANEGGVSKGYIQSDGRIILIGNFVNFNSVLRRGVVRLNSNGSIDGTFQTYTTSDGFADFFDISLASDGRICLAGDTAGSDVIKLLSNGLRDPEFGTGEINPTGGRAYSVLALSDGKMLVGGDFDGFFINGTLALRYGLARFNSDGTLDTSFPGQVGNSMSDGGVRALAADLNQKILLGGDFPQVDNTSRGGLSRLNSGGSVDNSFVGFFGTPTFVYSSYVYADGKILIGGGFQGVSGIFSSYAARLNADGTVDTTFQCDPRVNSQVNAIAVQSDGKILLGGSADNFSILRKGIWRTNADGSLDTGFDARIDAYTTIRAILPIAGGKILIAGSFTKVNDVERRGVARLNSDGSLDTSFNPVLSTLSVSTIVQQTDGKIIVGGNITHANGLAVGNIARLNPDGTTDATFNAGLGANNSVGAISLRPDGKIYVAGGFSRFNGESRQSVVRLQSNGAIDTDFKSAQVSSDVYSLVQLPGNKILIGGTVSSSVNAAPRNGIVRLLENGVVDFSFDLRGVSRGGSTGEVFRIALQPDGKIIATGQFDTINGSSKWGITRLLNFTSPTRTIFDFDGDGRIDLSVFRPSSGNWLLKRSQLIGSTFSQQLGNAADKLVPGDYDGDYLTDLAVYRPSDGTWNIYDVTTRTIVVKQFGVINDIPVPADYDGDGITDIAVFRPSDGNWWIDRSRDGLIAVRYGEYGDLPVAGDYDGDGRADLAVFRPQTAEWIILRSTDGVLRRNFGAATDSIVPRDFDGDGNCDLAVFSPADNLWKIMLSTSGSILTAGPFALSPIIPTPSDYDGDGIADIAFFRPSDGSWQVYQSSGGTVGDVFGQNGDRPVPAAFVRTANFVSVSGRVTSPSGIALRSVLVSVVDSLNVVRTATTSSFGVFSLDNLVPGSYTIRATSKRYRFQPYIVQVNGNMTNLDFVGLE